MRVERESGRFSHHLFRDLPQLLRPNDLLVLNDTRVFPARLLGRRAPDGGKIEALLLRRVSRDQWWALVRPGKKIKEGNRLIFARGPKGPCLEAVVEAYGPRGEGERLLRFRWEGDWWESLEEVGHTPLPPYILKARKRNADGTPKGRNETVTPEAASARALDASPASEGVPEAPEDRARYQTVYATGEPVSVAAPTAGLHFSEPVLSALDARGIDRVFLQLDVGVGTFRPIQTERVEDHPIQAEHFRLSAETADRINQARAAGRRVVAVGTTVVRALETAALVARGEGSGCFEPDPETGGGAVGSGDAGNERIGALSGWTRLLITPGFPLAYLGNGEIRNPTAFRGVTDALLTNFHLPRSSLLVLVSAFAGAEIIRRAYAEAIGLRYRFYSYGDCMLTE